MTAIYHLQKITQSWNGVEHIYAQFDYENIAVQANFSGFAIDGPMDNPGTPEVQENLVPVISRVITDDGERHVFTYNSWGIVQGIWRYGSVDNQLAAMLHYYPTNTQTDTPRFYERADWAYYWLGYTGSSNPDEWSRSYYSFATNSNAETVTLPGGGSGKAGKVTLPDNTIHKELYTTSGWQAGIPLGSETWALQNGQSVKKRWSETTWESSSTVVPLNPRVTLSKVYDSPTNYRTIAYDYTITSNVYLPAHMDEGGSSGFIRSTAYSYLSYVNPNRRIIGLPSEITLRDANNVLVSSVTYLYDSTETGFMQDAPNVIRHDSTNFGTNFIAGRGNLTHVRRWDVNDQGGNGAYTETKTAYNKTGSVIFTRDALDHQTDIEYTDSFSDNINRNTYAYPTKITDPDGRVASTPFYSTMKYDFNFGGITSATNPKGAVSTTTYDTGRRVTKVKNEVTGAYTKYVYSENSREVDIYTTIADNSLPDTLAARPYKAYSKVVYDGAGRVRATAADHPGSAGGYRVTYNHYDNLGRLWKYSNPTEVNELWSQYGDDAAGWVWNYQAYDWKGRPTITTNQDGTTKQLQYEGCGCAGGQVTTAIDEIGRKQKTYYDNLGRVKLIEVLNTDNSVYSATAREYNVRDQVLFIKQYAGAAPEPVNGVRPCTTGCQQTEMQYDGYARLWKRKSPMESDFTTFAYNNDDTLLSSTDARGAAATISYNNRHLKTAITYSVPSGVTATPNVTFSYDELGNRTMMDDGPGRVDYVYDTQGLGRLMSETRTFDDFASGYQLSYTYNLAGQLSSVTDPFNSTINYSYDKVGQLATVTGSAFAGVTQYINSVSYRAWGATKQITYNNASVTMGYNSRLKVNSYLMPGVADASYSYYNDGRLSGLTSTGDQRLNRTYTYDLAGRVTSSVANGGSTGVQQYTQTYSYDAFGNFTYRYGRYWWVNDHNFASTTFSNGRITSSTETTVNGTTNYSTEYDASGNILRTYSVVGGNQVNKNGPIRYDAAGRVTGEGVVSLPHSPEQTRFYDGDGGLVKVHGVQYYVRSSALGGEILTTLNTSGQKDKTTVYANGQIIAQQYKGTTQSNDWISYWRRDPHNTFTPTGEMIDPLGVQVRRVTAQEINSYWQTQVPAPGGNGNPNGVGYSASDNSNMVCKRDGAPASCNSALANTNNNLYFNEVLQHMGGFSDLEIEESKYNARLQLTYKYLDSRARDKDGKIIPGWFRTEDGELVREADLDWNPEEGQHVAVISAELPLLPQTQQGPEKNNTVQSSNDTPTCTIQVYDRGIEAFKGLPIPGAKHGYIILTDGTGNPHVFEGKNEGGRLVAVDSVNGPYAPLRSNNPSKNKKRGEKSGTDICNWLSILENNASRVNSVNIKYSFKGPNSNSVLRLMLTGLPDQSWYKMPWMIGWKSRLPNVEP